MASLLRCVLQSAGLLETRVVEYFHRMVETDLDFRRPLPLGFLGKRFRSTSKGFSGAASEDSRYPVLQRPALLEEMTKEATAHLSQLASKFPEADKADFLKVVNHERVVQIISGYLDFY